MTDDLAATRQKICRLDTLQHVCDQRFEGRERLVLVMFFSAHPLTSSDVQEFEAARKLGDRLVVALIDADSCLPSDRLRELALAMSAFQDVDLLVEAPASRCVELVRQLRPHVYVRPPEETGSASFTEWRARVEAAVREAGGAIESSRAHANPARCPVGSPPSAAGWASMKQLRSQFSFASVEDLLQKSRSVRTLLIGETIIDEYVYCQAIGKSSKEPTLVVKQDTSELFAGGILAVANHMDGFCDNLSVVTMLGSRDRYDDLLQNKLNPRIRRSFLTRTGAPTIRKRRYIEQYHFHKLFEVYDIDDGPMAAEDEAALCSTLQEQLDACDLVVVFDFGHGMFTQQVVDLICDRSRMLVVNTQSNAGNLGYHTVSKYSRADVVCLTEAELRLEVRDRSGDVRVIVEHLAGALNCKRIVVTRGSRGCLLYEHGRGFAEVAAMVTDVVDRVGAGDGFLSLAALMAYQQAPLELIGLVGNVAGGQAACTIGHRSSITHEQLMAHLKYLFMNA